MTEWITFAEAGKRIDGPSGWACGDDNERLSAQSLLSLAARGDIPVSSSRALIRYDDKVEHRATEVEQFGFLSLLLAREKLGDNTMTALIAPGMTNKIVFTLFDEPNGNFELTEVLDTPSVRSITKRYVVGLRFSADAIDEFFGNVVRSEADHGLPVKKKPVSSSELPSVESIAAKMLELTNSGLNRDEAAKQISLLPGFELVGNQDARDAYRGQRGRGRPPKKSA